MIYYPKPDSHIRDKVKVVLDLSTYATKKELDHATNVDISGLAAEKAEVDKPDIKKHVNISTSFNTFETKVDDLDVCK